MDRMRSHVRVLIASLAVLALTAAACNGGGQQQGQQDDQGGPPAELEEFCTAVVDAEMLVVSEGPEADVEPLLKQVEETAPDEIQEDVGIVVAGVRAGAEDPSEFQKPRFSEADEAVDQYVVDNCGYERVDVEGTEYAFEGIPESIPSGRVSLVFSNAGEEVHEMIVFRINDGVEESFQEILDQGQEAAMEKITFVAGAFAPPGESDAEVVELEPGSYGVSCFVPMGTTDPEQGGDGPPHFTEGMIAEFTVE